MGKRETALNALLTKITAAGHFSVIGRRNVSPETIATPNAPALLLLTHHEHYTKPQLALPAKKTITVMACIYVDTGNAVNAIPDSVINNLQDYLDDALVPDNLATGFCTLGGAVFSAHIVGDVIRAPGDKSGKGLAIVPIDIILI